jgi:hypothetical protein
MTTLVGDAIKIVLGNKDFLVVLAGLTISLSIVFTIIAAWKYKE